MTKKDYEIVAMVECMLIWDRLAETGEDDKIDVIDYLYENGLIHKITYKSSCPFCDFYKDCSKCRWPRYKTHPGTQCLRKYSYYANWCASKCPQDRKHWSKKILNMLMEIDF